MVFDIKYMQRCLQLAEYASSFVAPNPMVGAVLVCNDMIIGEGFHQHYGEPHAEPNAINSVSDKSLLSEASLYVNLEPCSYYGKTPPCADLIVRSKIPRVIIGTLDPNPKVAGKGVEILRNAGIEVIVGVMEDECRELNKRFFIFQEQKRPYILLKWAQTFDGFIDKKRKNSNELPLIISNSITKQLTHKMRAENQAILVGTKTVILDNPSLTVRNWSGKSPIRITIDRHGIIPANYNLLDSKVATIIFTEKQKSNQQHLEFVNIGFQNDTLKSIVSEIYARNINSVMVEGGAKLINCFIDAGLWDEANVEISPKEIHNGVAAPIITTQAFSEKTFDGHKWLLYKR
jgi:diaminohydroxyphosphoribosylaminopyrimidine deaminase/5-amino-6-(5-phosphoribosylamino)uracil reductase